MTTSFPVTITTAEELRLLEQGERARFLPHGDSITAVFDKFDCIRAHGLSVKLEGDNAASCLMRSSRLVAGRQTEAGCKTVPN